MTGPPRFGGAQLLILLAAVLVGAALGLGWLKAVLLFLVAAVAMAAVTRFPEMALSIAVVVTCSLPVLALGEALSVGPVSLHWTDVSFVALGWAGAVVASRLRGDLPAALVGHSLLVLPLALVLAAKAAVSLANGIPVEFLGAVLRDWAWYLLIPAVALVFAASGKNDLLRRTILAVALFTSVTIVIGAASQRGGAFLSELMSVKLVELPGYEGELGRLYLPGRTLLPTALALVVAALVWEVTKGRTRAHAALAVAYVSGIVSTLGRGMWIAVGLAFGAALSIRINGRIAGRLAVVIAIAIGLFVTAALVIGRTPEMPGGLVDLVASRAEELVAFDSSANVRFKEIAEVRRQIVGHEILGVPFDQEIGLMLYLEDGQIDYTVHNGYWAVYGRLGALGLAAFLLPLSWGLVLGVRLVATEEGSRLAWSLAGLVGLLRVMLVSWTQFEPTEWGGIFVFVLSVGVLFGLAATRTRTA